MKRRSAHALPRVFSLRARVRPVPWVALIVLTAAALGFALVARLTVISTFASATFLHVAGASPAGARAVSALPGEEKCRYFRA